MPVRGTGSAGDRPSPFNLPAASTRHDGWTGEKMATFCETLAETAVVAEACDQAGMGISGAYALRRRNPFFAAAWDAALTIARERLADTLLARSIEAMSSKSTATASWSASGTCSTTASASRSSAASTASPKPARPSAVAASAHLFVLSEVEARRHPRPKASTGI